jgi:hypothetical protein
VYSVSSAHEVHESFGTNLVKCNQKGLVSIDCTSLLKIA